MTTVLANNAFEMLPMRIPGRFAPNDVYRAPRAVRQKVFLRPEQNGSYTKTGNKITFTLPATGVCDFINGGLMFNALTTNTLGTYSRFHKSVWLLISRIKISQGARVIEDAGNYGRFAHMVYMATREQGFDSVIPTSLFGIDSAANRSAKGAAGADYFIPLLNGFFNMPPVNLAQLMAPITIEITLAQPTDCMECDNAGAVLDYVVKNVMLHYERLEFENSSTEAEAILKNNVFKFNTFRRYDTNNTASSIDLVVPHRTNAVDTLLTVQNSAADLINVTVNDRFETWLFNNAVSYQAQINGGFYPQEPISSGVMSYLDYLTFIGRWSIHGSFMDSGSISLPQHVSNKYIEIMDLRAFPYSPALLNPVGFTGGQNSITLKRIATAPPAVQNQISTYVIFECIFTLKDGIINVSE